MLKITNTLSGQKEVFVPLNPGSVLLYVCGITPYDYAHVGHGRVYVTFDVLYRLLQFLDYDVSYARNFTDVDDKLLNRAERELGDRLRYLEVANKYIDAYHGEMEMLGCLAPTYEPRVTETIPEIIDFIKGLIAQDKAYVVDGDVYYSIDSFPDYCKLSKQKLDELRAGARVEVSDIKRDPLDFALWKAETEGTFWKSPWGYGRPGWHIECSAMAQKFLGDCIDIHGGGMDLIFPHHENEIAQTEGLTGKQFAQCWLHNAFITVNKEKMSKSLGNFFCLKDIFKEVHPLVMRMYLLAHHYRAPIDFSLQEVEATHTSYQRLARFFETHPVRALEGDERAQREAMKKSVVVGKMLEFLCDDLNTSGMFGVLHEHLKELAVNDSERAAVKAFVSTVLGLPLALLPEKEVEITPEIERLLQERSAARAAKDFVKADTIRDQLVALGFDVRDSKS